MRSDSVGRFRLEVPSTRRERRVGLLGRRHLGPNDGLWLRRCRSVHTFGMRFAIDAVLLDGHDRVIHVVRMRPRRLILPRPGVRSVIEVAAGRGEALRAALAHEIH